MTALIEKIASTSFSKRLAQFLIPHERNNHHPFLIRHESLFLATFLILAVQFFSLGRVSSNRVLGYGTDINKDTRIALTNQERTSRGIPALKENQLLDTAASLKGQDMFAKDYWAHFAPDGTSPWYFFKKVGYSYSWAGENLARDFSTSAGVIAGWMASQGHRDNMLNPNFTEIGISVQNGTLQGDQTTLVVEHLAAPTAAAGGIAGAASSGGTAAQPTNVQDSFSGPAKKDVTASSSADVNKVSEQIAQKATGGFNLASFWATLGLGQQVTMGLLALLVSLFLFDSIIIFRKGVVRHNSHSFLHASVLAVLIVALIRGSIGGIL